MSEFTTGERGQSVLRPTGPPRDHSKDTFAMDTPRAADLPHGTVVATHGVAYIKNHPTDRYQWRGTDCGHVLGLDIDEALAAGARVLRYGYGGDGDGE